MSLNTEGLPSSGRVPSPFWKSIDDTVNTGYSNRSFDSDASADDGAASADAAASSAELSWFTGRSCGLQQTESEIKSNKK